MEKFNRIFRCGIGDGVIDFIGNSHTSHWNGPVCQCLCHGDNVWFDIEFLRRKRCPHATKAGDNLVKHQQKSSVLCKFRGFFQITNRGTNVPVDPATGSINTAAAAAKVFSDPFKIQGKLYTSFWLALLKALILLPSVTNCVKYWQGQAKSFAVAHYARQRNAAMFTP